MEYLTIWYNGITKYFYTQDGSRMIFSYAYNLEHCSDWPLFIPVLSLNNHRHKLDIKEMNTLKRVHSLIWWYQINSIFISFLDGNLKLVYNAKILHEMSAVVIYSCGCSADIDATLHHSKYKRSSVSIIDWNSWEWMFLFYFSAFKSKIRAVSVLIESCLQIYIIWSCNR